MSRLEWNCTLLVPSEKKDCKDQSELSDIVPRIKYLQDRTWIGEAIMETRKTKMNWLINVFDTRNKEVKFYIVRSKEV